MFNLFKRTNKFNELKEENAQLVKYTSTLLKINKALIEENEDVRETSFEYYKASKDADTKVECLENNLMQLSKTHDETIQKSEEDIKKLKTEIMVLKRKLTISENKVKKLEGDK